MKKFYSLLAAITLSTVAANAQGTTTVTISLENIDADLFPAGTNSLAETTFELEGIEFGVKNVGRWVGNSAQFKTVEKKSVFYNTTALPGRIVSIEISGTGGFDIYGGNDGRLINDVSDNYTVSGTKLNDGPTDVEKEGSKTGWDASFFEEKGDYTWFALKRSQTGPGNGGNGYQDYIKITYEDPLGIDDIEAPKVTLVRNTVVNDEIIFGTDAKVAIYNTAGKLVKTAEVAENTQLNISDFAAGTYIVTATVNGKAISEKIIKK